MEERPGFLDRCNVSLWGWLVMRPGREKGRYGAFGGGDKFLGGSVLGWRALGRWLSHRAGPVSGAAPKVCPYVTTHEAADQF